MNIRTLGALALVVASALQACRLQAAGKLQGLPF